MKRKVAACYLKKGMAYCLMGAMLLGLSIGTAGCGKEQKGTQEAEGNTEIQEVEGNDGPIEIVYWNQWTQEDETAFLKKYVEEYNSSQDNIMYRFWLFRMKSIRLQSWPLHLLPMKLRISLSVVRQSLTSTLMQVYVNHWMILLPMK